MKNDRFGNRLIDSPDGRLIRVSSMTLLVTLGMLFSEPVSAQVSRRDSAAKQRLKTQVSFELLMATRVPPLAAQQWGEVFRRAGADVRIRQALGSDRTELTETKRGSVRLVKAVGLLDRDGSIVFENRRFRQSQAGSLAEWIRELKTYGAQGNDDGKPGFGLTGAQFDLVFRALAGRVSADPAGQKLKDALSAVGLPSSLPLRLTPAAEAHLSNLRQKETAVEGLAGLSRGAVLAILLNDAGLGFRPGRTPDGNLELRVSPLTEPDVAWPIGWPLEKPPITAMPKLVEVVPVELDGVPLVDVIDAISIKTELPIFTDHRRIEEAGVSLDVMKVDQEYRKMTWSGLLDRVTFPHLMRELLQDEAGTPFVFITTRTVAQLNERARQRERMIDQKVQ